MQKFVDLIITTLNEIGEEDDNQALMDVTPKTKLFGTNGVLDSVGVVFLITELEEKLSDDFDVDVSLADEKAMSQITSPFRNIETLAKYIELLVAEA